MLSMDLRDAGSATRSPLKPHAPERAVVGLPAVERIARDSRPALAERRERVRDAVGVVNGPAHSIGLEVALMAMHPATLLQIIQLPREARFRSTAPVNKGMSAQMGP